MRRATAAALTGLIMCFLAGCAGRSAPPVTFNLIHEGPANLVTVRELDTRLNRAVSMNKTLALQLACDGTWAKRTPTNTIEVIAQFRNRTNHDLSIQARTQFFGPERMPNEGPHEWQTIFLPPNGTQTYRTYSHGTTAEYYFIEVMYAR